VNNYRIFDGFRSFGSVCFVSSIWIVSLLVYCSPTLAGGGDIPGGSSGSSGSGGTNGTGNSSANNSTNGTLNNSTLPTYSGGSSSLGNGLINNTITPISPLQSSSGFSSTTSYYNNGIQQACGFYVNGGVGNSNSLAETVFDVRLNYATQKCVDVKKLELIKQEAETSRAKLNVQGDVLINCMKERTNALSLKHNPDEVCKVPDLSLMESLLR
jgi:hypothetical protein